MADLGPWQPAGLGPQQPPRQLGPGFAATEGNLIPYCLLHVAPRPTTSCYILLYYPSLASTTTFSARSRQSRLTLESSPVRHQLIYCLRTPTNPFPLSQNAAASTPLINPGASLRSLSDTPPYSLVPSLLARQVVCCQHQHLQPLVRLTDIQYSSTPSATLRGIPQPSTGSPSARASLQRNSGRDLYRQRPGDPALDTVLQPVSR